MLSVTAVRERLRGPIVPMPTPFRADHAIDFDGVRRYTRFLIDSGISVISPLGSTGEFFTMTMDEHKAVLQAVVAETAGRALVLAGAGHSGTMVASQLAAYARSAGADAVLICAPYYMYDGAEGIYQHYRTIGEQNDIPLVIYSNREVMANLALMARLFEIPTVVGVKEATGSYPLYRDLCIKYGDRVAILGGGSMGHFLWGHLWGSPAYFASVGNFVPQVELAFFEQVAQGNMDEARRIVREIELPFMDVAIRIGWWRSLKAAMNLLGLPGGHSRLPNRDVSEEEREELRQVMERTGLLNKAT